MMRARTLCARANQLLPDDPRYMDYLRELFHNDLDTIRKNAWIGMNVTICPGVTIGKYAVVGAGSVVTHDIPDYGVAVGVPAKVIRHLDSAAQKE